MLHVSKPEDVPEQLFPKISVERYTVGDKLVEDDNLCLAKELKGKTEKFYIRYNLYGIEAGRMVNPWGLYSNEQTSVSRDGRPYQELKEVSKEAYSSYRLFLKTQNEIYYRQAERLAIYG